MIIREKLRLLWMLPVILLAGCSGETYDLKFRPPHNSDYMLVFANKGDVQVTFAGNPFKTNLNTTMGCYMHFDSLPDGHWDVRFKYSDYKLNQSANGLSMNIDSVRKKTSGDSVNLLSMLQSLEFRATMSPLGQIVGQTDVDTIWKKVEQALGGLEDPARTQLAATLKPILNNDIFSGMLEQCFRVFPEKKVAVGDDWSSEIKMLTMFSMVINSQFTLKSVKDGVAEIEVDSRVVNGDPNVVMPGLAMVGPTTLTGPRASKAFDLMGIKMETNFTGTQQGTVFVDMGTGMILKSKVKQLMDGVFKINGLEMPMKMDMDLEYKTEKGVKG